MGATVFRRRVQVTGKSTLITSLPKEWAESVGLKPGSEVIIEVMPDLSLRITYQGGRARKRMVKSIRVTREDDYSMLLRQVISSYIAGYDVVRLEFGEEDSGKAFRVRELVERIVLGLNVLEETNNSIVFYSVVDPSSIELRNAISRASRVAYSMMTDLVEALSRGKEEILGLVIERDQLVDKLYLLTVKQLTQALMGFYPLKDLGLASQAEVPHIFLVAKSVERAADHAHIIASNLKSSGLSGGAVEKTLASLLDEASSIFKMAAESFLSMDRGMADEVARRVEKFRSLESVTRNGMVKEEAGTRYYLILDSIKRIASYSLDIAEAVIDILAIRGVVEDLARGRNLY